MPITMPIRGKFIDANRYPTHKFFVPTNIYDIIVMTDQNSVTSEEPRVVLVILYGLTDQISYLTRLESKPVLAFRHFSIGLLYKKCIQSSTPPVFNNIIINSVNFCRNTLPFDYCYRYNVGGEIFI